MVFMIRAIQILAIPAANHIISNKSRELETPGYCLRRV